MEFYQKLERVAPFPIKVVKTDHGAEFLGEFDHYLPTKGVIHYFNYPRTPNSNSSVERFNRPIQEEFVEYHLDRVEDLKEFKEVGLPNDHLLEYLLFFNAVRSRQALNYLTPLGKSDFLGYLVKNQLASNICPYLTQELDTKETPL